MGIKIISMDANRMTLSCGCRIETVGGNFIIKPCSMNCKVLKYALEESRKQGNEISFQVEKDER